MEARSFDSQQYNLLLVEDDPGDARLLKGRFALVQDYDFKMAVAQTLNEAVTCLRNDNIDAVILDLNLPDSNGIDTVRKIRQSSTRAAIVVFSGSDDIALRDACYQEGALDYICKNDRLAQLLAYSVRYALERQKTVEHRQQINTIVAASPDAVLIVNADEVVQFANEAACILFETDLQDFIGKPLPFSVRQFAGTTFDLPRSDGKRIVEMRVVRCEWQRAPAYLASIRDITEQEALRDELRQSQKMEAIGRLAGGVAHDFNNMLQVINGNANLLLQKTEDLPPLSNFASEILQAGERAAALTRQLLAFGRKSVVNPVPLNLNTLIREMHKMLDRLISKNIELVVDLDPELGLLIADMSQMEQVVMNLVINARDAMPKGGQLTIKTCNVTIGARRKGKQQAIPKGNYLNMTISDSGLGMSEEVQARIFEPFFTTKHVGRGTGLGLATTYGIIKQSNGHITVHSEIGKGSSFSIYLPRLDENRSIVEEVKTTGLSVAALPTGTETVLLAEDEEGVRSLITLLLKDCGYTVLAAVDGEHAMELANSHAGDIHLLISDIAMPNISGQQLAQTITEGRSGIKVLYISGYAGDSIGRQGETLGETMFLQKPFSPAALARKVRQVLDG